MEILDVLQAFSSLSQETRLRVFRLLIEYGRDGLLPGSIAKELEMPDNTLSFHLSHMAKAKLVHSKKEGRSITYFANTALIVELIQFLQMNCCAKENKNKCSTGRKKKGCS